MCRQTWPQTYRLPHIRLAHSQIQSQSEIMQTAISKTITALSIFALVGMLWAPQARAQMGPDPSPVNIGVRGGLTQAALYGDDVDDSGFRSGFVGGVFLSYEVNQAFSIQPEVLYSRRGGDELDLATTPGDDNLEARHDFLEVPVLFKLSAPFAMITPRVYAGPSVGFLLNSEIEGEDADDSFKNVDFGGVVGGEIALDLNRQTGGIVDEIAIDGRYNVGIVNLGDTDALESVRTNAFTGTLSLRFNI